MKRIINFLLCSLVYSALFAQKTESIQQAMANYDYQKVIELINTSSPTNSLLLIKGKALKSLGAQAEALNVYQEILNNDSLNQQALIETAECYKQLGQYDRATCYYEKAIDNAPQNTYLRLQYINLLLIRQHYQEAFTESSLLAERDSSLYVLHLQAQSLENRKGQIDAAIGCYHIIAEKYPTDYLAAAKLGALYNGVQMYDYAIEATEKYRSFNTENRDVNRQNAFAYCMNKEYAKATERYEKLLQQKDSTIQTLYYSGICYYAQEDYYSAHDVLEKAKEADPKNVSLLYYLGRSCAKTSWKKEGVEYLNEAIKLSIPQDSTLIQMYKALADSYKMARQPKEQISTLEQLYVYDKENHKLLYDIAAIYQQHLSDNANAERYFKQFLKTRTASTPISNTLKTDEKGQAEFTLENYYASAQRWIREFEKERFFSEGVKKSK